MEPDAARRHLEAESERLQQVRAAIESDHFGDEPEEDSSAELSHFDQHPADAASDAFEREKELSILDRVQAELDDVERALQRLDEGTYGLCEACGSAIGDERLAAVPAARFCVDHQNLAET
ncbi:MAG TPA: TraR/DksA C4-type zinc finger protein [Acidimicrobiales bacterium]